MLKSKVSDIYSHKEMKIKISLVNTLPLEKTITIHDL